MKTKKGNKKKIITIIISFLIFYFVCGFILNYFCYSKTVVHIWQSTPLTTILKAIDRIRNTNNSSVKSKLTFYLFFCEGIPFVLYIFAVLYFLSGKNKIKPDDENERRTLKGSAEWGNSKDYENLYVYDWEPYENLPPVILGQTYDAVLDSSNPQDIKTINFGSKIIGCDPTKINIMTMGGIGSLKGVSTIVPTLLSYKESVIVYDPAKENFNITAGFRQTLGRVQYFDPTDMNCSLHFNALDWVRKDKNYVTADIDNICSILIPSNDKDRFFTQNARNLLSIYIAYVILFFPKEKQNLKEVTNLINILQYKSIFHYNSVEKRIKKLKNTQENNSEIENEINYWTEYLTSLSLKEKQEMNTEWQEEKTGNMVAFMNRLISDLKRGRKYLDQKSPDRIWKEVLLERASATAQKMKITAAAEQTIAGIEGEITSNMHFFAETVIASLTKRTSFTVQDINRSENPISLYLCISNADTERCKTFVKLFISCVLKQLTSDYTIKRTHHTLFILDEFPQLERIDEVILAIPFVRKYGISFLLIFQSISQLESETCYGKADTKSLRANTKILDIKQIGDPDDATWVAKQLGKKTIILENESKNIKKNGKNEGKSLSIMTEGRNLLNETELTQLPAEESILIIGQNKPLRIKKLQYFFHPYFQSIANIPYDCNKEKPYKEKDTIPVSNPNIIKVGDNPVIKTSIEVKEQKKRISIEDIIL